MKLSSFVAIAAVIGGSFLIPIPAEADQVTDTKEKLIGLAAFAGCKMTRHGYTVEQARSIIDDGIVSMNAEDYRVWMDSSKVANAVQLFAKAMNDQCTTVNTSSPYLEKAINASHKATTY